MYMINENLPMGCCQGCAQIVHTVYHCAPPCCCHRTYVQHAHLAKVITEPSDAIIAQINWIILRRCVCTALPRSLPGCAPLRTSLLL